MISFKLFFESYLNEIDINNIVWYHGSSQKRDDLNYGNGIDGRGIYLTRDKDRAKIYSKRNTQGEENKTTYIHEIKINVDIKRVWDYSKNYDLKNLTNASWLKDMIQKNQSTIMDGSNAAIYLFGGSGRNNQELIDLGYQAILTYSDLIVLDKKIIVDIK